jgi:NodT family efflux transporter outer membrane factor (OMF) lipoprotein
MPDSDDTSILDLASWWRGFNDAKLNALVERALQSNLDLQTADARLAAARAQRIATSASLWPSLSGTTSYQRERISPNALKGLITSSRLVGNNGPANGLLSSLGPIGQPFNLFQAGFDANWELDIFGGLKRQAESSEASAQAAVENQRGIRVSLSAEVARDYLDLIVLRRRLEIAKLRLNNYAKLENYTRNAYQEGLILALDARRAQAEREAAAAAVPDLEAQVTNTRHALAFLLGQPPTALDHELADIGSALPTLPAVPAGLPSDLLRRRPDIRQAERELAAATALVGAAVAELFPKITLTGSVGLQSQDLGNFYNTSSGFYGFGPRLSLPIFQAGRLQANVDAQEAHVQEALHRYQQTVLMGLREVEDTMTSALSEWSRKQALASAEATSRRAAEDAVTLYTEGEANLQTVLDTQRTWYDSQERLALSELAWATGHVALFKALGGGWNLEDGQH